MATAPIRSLDQRHAALAEANRRRTLRAQRKALWRRGAVEEARADLFDLMERPDEWAATWRVWDVLLAQPRIGAVKARRILNEVGISPIKTLAGLTERQARELRALLASTPFSPPSPTKHGLYNPGPCADCGGPRSENATCCFECSVERRRKPRFRGAGK